MKKEQVQRLGRKGEAGEKEEKNQRTNAYWVEVKQRKCWASEPSAWLDGILSPWGQRAVPNCPLWPTAPSLTQDSGAQGSCCLQPRLSRTRQSPSNMATDSPKSLWSPVHRATLLAVGQPAVFSQEDLSYVPLYVLTAWLQQVSSPLSQCLT